MQARCIVTSWFWVGIHTYPQYSSSPLHIYAAIYSGPTSSFNPCRACFVRVTTLSGRFHPYTIRSPLYDPAGYTPSIHNLHGMGHCIVQKGRQGECGAVESKSILIGTRCHLATADNTSDSDNKVATRGGENTIYKATCIFRKYHLTSSRSLPHVLGTFPSLDETLNSPWSICPQTVSNSLDQLSDPHMSLFNHITPAQPSIISSEPVDKCFVCVRVHGFPVCVPSFCKKGHSLKNKNWLLKKLRLR